MMLIKKLIFICFSKNIKKNEKPENKSLNFEKFPLKIINN